MYLKKWRSWFYGLKPAEKVFEVAALSSSIMQCPLFKFISGSEQFYGKVLQSDLWIALPCILLEKGWCKKSLKFRAGRGKLVKRWKQVLPSSWPQETFPLSVHFPLPRKSCWPLFVCWLYIWYEWMLNVQCFNFHPTYCHLPTLMMSWEVHKRWCSSAGWWREHREPVWVKFLTRMKIKWWIIVALPGLEVPWRPEHFAHGPC